MSAHGIPIDGVVAADLPCVGCGYNVRMLSVESNCPECPWLAFLTVIRACGGDFRKRHRMATGFRFLGMAWLLAALVALTGLIGFALLLNPIHLMLLGISFMPIHLLLLGSVVRLGRTAIRPSFPASAERGPY